MMEPRPPAAPALPADTAALLATLHQWVAAGALRPLDLALTDFLMRKSGETDPAVVLAIALVSARHGQGHVCLDLAAALADPNALLGETREDPARSHRRPETLAERLPQLTPGDWAARLATSPVVADRLGPGADDGAAPLVLAGGAAQPRLYLRRYWHYENQIRDGIQARLERDLAVDVAALNEPLRALFGTRGDEDAAQPDWQRIACALAARQAFAIITGGPGTGKTTTVVRLLAVLQGLAAAGGAPPLRIELAAPTGKAAARLNESIADQIRGLASPPGIADSLPTQVKTLHRLLGTLPNSRHFRHQAAHPLAADLVVVDEASMIDVEMMARLLDALRPDARLILLGDKDQLSSVEAGAVLGDLCRRAAAGHYRPETAAWLRQASGDRLPDALIDPAGTALDQSIVMLRQSYRFRADGGIGALAACVNETIPPPPDGRDRLTAVKRLFAHAPARPGQDPDSLQAVQLAGADDARFARLIEEVYGAPESYLRVIRDNAPDAGADPTEVSAWARRVLEAQRRFQLLTALRQGAWGVEGLNQRIIERLRAHGLLAADPHAEALPTGPQRHWFPGRPVMVTRNDYGLNLMNGDLGVTLPWPAPGRPDRAILRVAFPTVDGGVRWVLPSRLQSVETVFALTVHKSQGSEFDHAALILPDRPNPVLTRELLYTAITRAKHRFTLLYSEEQVLAEALEQRVQRASGLIGIAEAEPFEPLRDATAT